MKFASYYCSMLVFFFCLSTATITYSKYTTVDGVTKSLGWRHSSKVICRLATDSSLLYKWWLNQFESKFLHRLTLLFSRKNLIYTEMSLKSLLMFSSKNTSELSFLSKKNKAKSIDLNWQNASRYIYQIATRNINWVKTPCGFLLQVLINFVIKHMLIYSTYKQTGLSNNKAATTTSYSHAKTCTSNCTQASNVKQKPELSTGWLVLT